MLWLSVQPSPCSWLAVSVQLRAGNGVQPLACPRCLTGAVPRSALAADQPQMRQFPCAVTEGACLSLFPKGSMNKAALPFPAFVFKVVVYVWKGCGPLCKPLLPSHLASVCKTLSSVLQTCGCWRGTAFTFRDLFSVKRKHSVLNNGWLKLQERCLRARGDPEPGALCCGYRQSVLLGFGQRTDPVCAVFGGVAVALTFR